MRYPNVYYADRKEVESIGIVERSKPSFFVAGGWRASAEPCGIMSETAKLLPATAPMQSTGRPSFFLSKKQSAFWS